ncbi:hypothetical protein MMC08_000860 [Hypocenomyce scalaris]|nr:hypothetical protein [Hypocenomyce scalaris]
MAHLCRQNGAPARYIGNERSEKQSFWDVAGDTTILRFHKKVGFQKKYRMMIMTGIGTRRTPAKEGGLGTGKRG